MSPHPQREVEPRTIVDKILDAHTIHEEGGRTLLYVDRVIASDTALSAFSTLRRDGHTVLRPSQAVLITDHFAPSKGRTLADASDDERRMHIRETDRIGRNSGMRVFGLGDPRRGIQHVVAIEQAYAQPGIVVVGTDSHTCTQGAVGALALSVGTDLAHALATQCVWLKRPGTMRIALEGSLSPLVTAKDVVLALLAALGARGASGLAVEYAGSFTSALPVAGRMTLCNLSVEMGARLAIIAPDDTSIAYLRGRRFSPPEAQWQRAVAFWRTLPSDTDALYVRDVTFDVSGVEPMVTWGTNAESAIPINGLTPDPSSEIDPERRAQVARSLDYMGLASSTRMTDVLIDYVFIGSCANSTVDDLRDVASVMRGRKVVVPTLIIPGSSAVRTQAEDEGLAEVFRSAGAAWGEASCSMCNGMNGDTLPQGARCASTANRNHEGRQGPGVRTHLMSPAMAGAAALVGRLVDVRRFDRS